MHCALMSNFTIIFASFKWTIYTNNIASVAIVYVRAIVHSLEELNMFFADNLHGKPYKMVHLAQVIAFAIIYTATKLCVQTNAYHTDHA